jgi:Asp-tRNA(Asn)/Glu-tRNA(Gln) amidotransferase A subunit family amidase
MMLRFLAQNQIGRPEILSLIGLSVAATRSSGASGELERLEEWSRADRETRRRALALALERIRRLDPSIQAWVQVLPQPQTGDGPLSGIPFGAKDVIETKNLVTEYGSPIYKGRHGSADAAIIRRMQAVGAILVGKTQAAAFAFRTPRRHTTHEIWATRQAAVPADRPLPLPLVWYLSR